MSAWRATSSLGKSPCPCKSHQTVANVLWRWTKPRHEDIVVARWPRLRPSRESGAATEPRYSPRLRMRRSRAALDHPEFYIERLIISPPERKEEPLPQPVRLPHWTHFTLTPLWNTRTVHLPFG